MTIELPLEKKVNLINQVCRFESKKECSIREFVRFIGLLVASCPGVEYGLIHSKLLEEAKVEALKENYGDFDGKIEISQYTREDLN